VRKGFDEAGLAWPDRGYVRVLNLFYLCDRNLRTARQTVAAIGNPPVCPSERGRSPWTWFAWGGPDPQLDTLKERFARRRWARPFFVSTRSGRLEQRLPATRDFARHTQGMPHAGVVAFLAEHLAG